MKIRHLIFALILIPSVSNAGVCQKLVNEPVIKNSLFESNFNRVGKGCLYAVESLDFYGGYDFYIKSVDNKKFRLPRSTYMNAYATDILAVSFADFDSNGVNDIAIIFKALTNKDPVRKIAFYRGTPIGYEVDDDVGKWFFLSEGKNISDVKNAIRKK